MLKDLELAFEARLHRVDCSASLNCKTSQWNNENKIVKERTKVSGKPLNTLSRLCTIVRMPSFSKGLRLKFHLESGKENRRGCGSHEVGRLAGAHDRTRALKKALTAQKVNKIYVPPRTPFHTSRTHFPTKHHGDNLSLSLLSTDIPTLIACHCSA